MAIKITTALVTALVVGALIPPTAQHSRARRRRLSWRWFRRRWIPRWLIRTRLRGMGVASDTTVAIPPIMAGTRIAAVRITDAIEQQGAPLQRRPVAATRARGQRIISQKRHGPNRTETGNGDRNAYQHNPSDRRQTDQQPYCSHRSGVKLARCNRRRLDRVLARTCAAKPGPLC